MKLLRVGEPGAERQAVLDAGGIARDVSSVSEDFGPAFFAAGGLAKLAEVARDAAFLAGLPPAAGRTGAPVTRPGKVVCIGLNYSDHAAETGAATPERPVKFMKDPSVVVGPYDDVFIPRGSVKTDWEVELGVIIGTTARYLSSPEAALDVVAGYAVSHDVSERAFQLELSPQWDLGKSCERFNPLGPWLVTADEVPDLKPGDEFTSLEAEVTDDASVRSAVASAASVTGTALAVDGGMVGLRLRPRQ